MKTIRTYLLLASLMLYSSFVFAGSQTFVSCGDNCYLWTVTSTAGDTDTTTMNSSYATKVKGYYIYQIETDPAGPPTALWDIIITSSNGTADVLGDGCLNRSATLNEICSPSTFYSVSGASVLNVSAAGANNVSVIRVTFVR